MQFEHFTCMLIKHPEKSNADAKFVLTKSSVLLKIYTKLRSFFSFRPKAREKSNADAKCILTCRNPDSSVFLVVLMISNLIQLRASLLKFDGAFLLKYLSIMLSFNFRCFKDCSNIFQILFKHRSSIVQIYFISTRSSFQYHTVNIGQLQINPHLGRVLGILIRHK